MPILVHARVTLLSGSSTICAFLAKKFSPSVLGFFIPPSPFPEKIILEEVEGHFTSFIANKLTGGPSAPGLPGKPGFPVGP